MANDRRAKAIQFLLDLGRGDLAGLLKFSEFEITGEEVFPDLVVPALEITSPAVFTEALRGLSEYDQRRITEAVVATSILEAIPERTSFATGYDVAVTDADKLLPEILVHQAQMI